MIKWAYLGVVEIISKSKLGYFFAWDGLDMIELSLLESHSFISQVDSMEVVHLNKNASKKLTDTIYLETLFLASGTTGLKLWLKTSRNGHKTGKNW